MGRKITILALGSRGDVQPFVPLGQALQRAGHQMRVATFTAFAPLIQRAGLTFAALPGDAQALLHSAAQGDRLFWTQSRCCLAQYRPLVWHARP